MQLLIACLATPALAPVQNTTLHALVDSCHSGTVMNLPYNAVLDGGRFSDWEEEYPGQSWKRVRQWDGVVGVGWGGGLGRLAVHQVRGDPDPRIFPAEGTCRFS